MNKYMRPYASGHAERYSPYREVSDRRPWFDCVMKPSVRQTGADSDPRARLRHGGPIWPACRRRRTST